MKAIWEWVKEIIVAVIIGNVCKKANKKRLLKDYNAVLRMLDDL